jgi:phenylacetate-CoA ligase
MGRLDNIYARLPLWGQNAAVSAFGLYWNRLRFGAGYDFFVREYSRREAFDAAQWAVWQQEKLQRLLTIAAHQVPYYRDNWSAAQKSAAVAGQLDELPLLGKEPLRHDARSFVRDGYDPKRLLLFHTSGSTGTPVGTYWTARELRNSLALREVRSARWAGVSFSLPRATFSGRIVEPNANSEGPFHRFNVVEKQAYLSAFHLRPENAKQYVEALRRHGIVWMTGYAVSYYLLARMMLEQNLKIDGLRAIITTSEKLTPEMRAVMEEAYNCRVYEEYSNVENSLFASECEHGKLHLSSDVAVVEILKPDGTPCAPGESGEVVATCLMRSAQPFIRYRLGDVATIDEALCSCGRALPVLKEVVGRLEDVVIGPDGREMVRFHGIFVAMPHVREGQIVQETLHDLRVKVVPDNGFGPSDEAEIMRRMKQRLGDQAHISVETVHEIPRTKAGKFQAVISHLEKARTAAVATADAPSIIKEGRA